MPSLKKVTDEELGDVIDGLAASGPDLSDITKRIEMGYCADFKGLMQHVRTLNGLIIHASELNNILLAKLGLQDQKRDLEKLLRGRSAANSDER